MQTTLQGNEQQTTSLTGRRLIAFCVFGGIAGVLGYLCLVIPLSIMAIRGDPSGSGSGYAIALFIMLGPVAAAPGVLIGGLAALPIIDRALKATTRSRSDTLRFLVALAASALLGIGTSWLFAWLIGNVINSSSSSV